MKYKSNPIEHYEDSAWARFLRRPDIKDPGTKDGKLFRRRFRVPYPVFVDICRTLVERAEFKVDGTQGNSKVPSAPLALKVLAALRVLGRGECFDTCYELSNIHSETLRRFFHRFTAFYASQYDNYIKKPRTPTEVQWVLSQWVLSQYERLGFPGDIGSVDCVHLHWARSPAMDVNYHAGKSGVPTRAFEVIGIHASMS